MDHRFVMRHRGQLATLSWLLGQWFHVTGLHINLGLPLGLRRHLLRDIGELHSRCGGDKFLAGEFSFLVGRESLYNSEGLTTTADPATATYLDELFEGWAELHKPDPTFRRLAREVGDASTTSRIDWIYSDVNIVTLDTVAVQVGVHGRFMHRAVASEKSAAIRRRRLQARPGVSSSSFPDEFTQKRCGQTPRRRFSAAPPLFIEERQKGSPAARPESSVAGTSPVPSMLIDARLRAIRLVGAREQGAGSGGLSEDSPELATCAEAGRVNVPRFQSRLRTSSS